MKKKYIIIAVLGIIFVELFRGSYYQLVLKKKYIEVINYIEEHKTIDETLIKELQNNDNIILKYKKKDEATFEITLTKTHVILFLISNDINLNQKYIISRLN